MTGGTNTTRLSTNELLQEVGYFDRVTAVRLFGRLVELHVN